jgi:hypothetical protein
MFTKRKEVRRQPTPDELPAGMRLELAEPELPTTEPATNGHGAAAITLDTWCLCGHTRREHMGMRMDAKGRCLECECEEFGQAQAAADTDAETVARINAAIERVDRLIEAAAALQAQSWARGESARQSSALE